MQVRVRSANPHEPLAAVLAPMLSTTTRVELAVAFMTRYGVDLLLSVPPLEPENVVVVVSVRSPTDLDAIQDIHDRWPGRLWIDLGFEAPTEPIARSAAQLHSKVVVLASAPGQVDALVGSHNWTRMAMTGRNGEVGVHLSGSDEDREIQELRQHIQNLRRAPTCEPFDPTRIEFYRAIQRSKEEPEFELDLAIENVLVVRAEASAGVAAESYPARLVTFIASGSSGLDTLSTTTPVHFYLYESGDLHRVGIGAPRRPPLHYRGTVSMVNKTANGKVLDRAVNSVIQTRAAPIIDLTAVLPSGHDRTHEVVFDVVRCDKQSRSPKLYFREGAKPSHKTVLITTEAVDPGRDVKFEKQGHGIAAYSWWGQNWTRPEGLKRTFKLTIPYSSQVYEGDPYKLAEELIANRMPNRNTEQQPIRVERPGDGRTDRGDQERSGENPFWFRVGGWLRDEDV